MHIMKAFLHFAQFCIKNTITHTHPIIPHFNMKNEKRAEIIKYTEHKSPSQNLRFRHTHTHTLTRAHGHTYKDWNMYTQHIYKMMHSHAGIYIWGQIINFQILPKNIYNAFSTFCIKRLLIISYIVPIISHMMHHTHTHRDQNVHHAKCIPSCTAHTHTYTIYIYHFYMCMCITMV